MIEIDVIFQTGLGSIGKDLFIDAAERTLKGEWRTSERERNTSKGGRKTSGSKRIASARLQYVIVDDKIIHDINREFLGHDYPTDVITFPLDEDVLEAEIYISAETARRQAREYRVSVAAECARLAIHAVLHLTGYDDRSGKDRKAMKTREDYYLMRFLKSRERRSQDQSGTASGRHRTRVDDGVT